MNTITHYSDEIINAFVDGELAAAERRELLAAAAESDRLRQRICEAVQLKELVRGAYPARSPEGLVKGRSGRRGARMRHAAAAAVAVLAVSVALLLPRPEPGQRLADGALSPVLPLSTGEEAGETTRVVFHVSSADPAAARELLDQVELVLREYAAGNRPLKVEVIANNEGLRLLQQGRSPVAERIRRLDQRYQNLLFAACGNTLERLRRETGEQIRILPQAVIVQSGVSFVARRQQEGWAYIKV
ncbi:MAG TPA: hypothetical protein ENI96_00250 [Sedimenticola thiotaurini]|uniref:Zinc-finger domain-containing protein n=1 Tax=Sedimenticola thiotaurini TaxID=1543721 RepID=A0A831RJ59_9GAMM|nr:hypothetical protein [Sedimenticola thiotaurini]